MPSLAKVKRNNPAMFLAELARTDELSGLHLGTVRVSIHKSALLIERPHNWRDGLSLILGDLNQLLHDLWRTAFDTRFAAKGRGIIGERVRDASVFKIVDRP